MNILLIIRLNQIKIFQENFFQNFNDLGPKLLGRSSSIVISKTSFFALKHVTFIYVPNSTSIYLHAPQGGVTSSAVVTTTQSEKFTQGPSSATAAHRAALSAQIPEGYAAFSTLHPEYVFPVYNDRIQAPTLKPE